MSSLQCKWSIAHLFRLVRDLYVQLVQCLNVVRCECYRDQADLLLAQLGESADRIDRLGPLPRFGADFRLPSESPPKILISSSRRE